MTPNPNFGPIPRITGLSALCVFKDLATKGPSFQRTAQRWDRPVVRFSLYENAQGVS